MAKNVTMRDIAKKVGVSTVTVSKALTDKDGVGAELRAMIKATADEMGYTYTGIGDGFRRGRSYNIGVIVDSGKKWHKGPFPCPMCRSLP